MNPLEDYLFLALRASYQAGEAILLNYDLPPQFTLKANMRPITQADQDAHKIIMGALADFHEKLPILSEEGRNVPYPERKYWRNYWLVDPLDGTKEFLKKNGEFTVNIALVREGKILLGVVYLPAAKTFYFAMEGLGAYKSGKLGAKGGELIGPKGKLEDLVKASRKLQMGPPPKTGEILRVADSRSHPSPQTAEYLDKLGHQYKVQLTNAGSSIKFCLLAEGKIDLYPRFSISNEWDIAAGQVVVEQAGGVVVDLAEGKPLGYNRENLLNPPFLAGSKSLVESLL